jgi:hypothetical protein
MHEKEKERRLRRGYRREGHVGGWEKERVNWPVGWGSLKIYLDSYVPFMQTKDLRTRGQGGALLQMALNYYRDTR